MDRFPYYFSGRVVTGFGRGGKQLGCPTANLDDGAIARLPSDFPCGVFYGLAQVDGGKLYGMVMSVGWNPHFKNEKKTVEVHILHSFPEDFYGSNLRAVALGYLRSMTAFDSLGKLSSFIDQLKCSSGFADDLKEAIKNDIAVAQSNLSSFKIEDFEHMDYFNVDGVVTS
uniref:riboflavin kinase n=1 Tax=Ascaris lumbricoides TaxID=6252 RepID=A0A0M3I0P5_ASCLU